MGFSLLGVFACDLSLGPASIADFAQGVAHHGKLHIREGLIFATRPKCVSNLLVEAQEKRAALGNEDSAFGFEASIDFSLGEEIWSEDVATWEAKGGTHVTLRAMNTGKAMMGLETVDVGGPQGYIEAFGTFMRAVRG